MYVYLSLVLSTNHAYTISLAFFFLFYCESKWLYQMIKHHSHQLAPLVLLERAVEPLKSIVPKLDAMIYLVVENNKTSIEQFIGIHNRGIHYLV